MSCNITVEHLFSVLCLCTFSWQYYYSQRCWRNACSHCFSHFPCTVCVIKQRTLLPPVELVYWCDVISRLSEIWKLHRVLRIVWRGQMHQQQSQGFGVQLGVWPSGLWKLIHSVHYLFNWDACGFNSFTSRAFTEPRFFLYFCSTHCSKSLLRPWQSFYFICIFYFLVLPDKVNAKSKRINCLKTNNKISQNLVEDWTILNNWTVFCIFALGGEKGLHLHLDFSHS